MSEWSEDAVLLFLEAYQNEECIWNPKHSNHKERKKVNDAWTRLSAVMNKSVKELKNKKEILMATFRRHLKKKQDSIRSSSGANDIYKPIWYAYDQMESFLLPVYTCSKTINTDEFFHESDTYGNSPVKSDAVDPISCRSTKSPETCTAKRKSNCLMTNSNKHTYRQLDSSKMYCKDSNNEHNSQDQDEYDLYGQLLAKKLRKLDERQRDVAMHEIDIIMFRAKMQGLPSQTLNQTKSKSPIPRKLKSPIFIVTHQNTQYEDENISYEEHMQPETS